MKMSKRYITIDYEEYKYLLDLQEKLIALIWEIHDKKGIDYSLKNYIFNKLHEELKMVL